uniref:Retrotransposon gag domain-containing protein n=1 Tax=Cajanus cajan TaxID=3821 RepID=A0A151QQK1_CAJCA|nr:hypothetical protein KK1_046689 [Cajanus cajan]
MNVTSYKHQVPYQPQNSNFINQGNPHQTSRGYQPTSEIEHVRSSEKLQMLEERLKVVEGGSYDIGEAVDLCLVPDIEFPPKFKVPEFDKYKGTSCPKNHITMYCRKMVAYARNDKLLIHCFQDSLTRATLNWFELCNMSKKDGETFKEYAQRWREVAAQVEPPLSDREAVALFIDTLQAPFYDKMIGNILSNFSDIVIIGERIENGMRSGKIAVNSIEIAGLRKFSNGAGKKKEGDTNAVTFNSPRSPNNQPPYFYTPHMVYPNITAVSPHPQQPIHQALQASPTIPTARPPQSTQPWNQNSNHVRSQNTQDRKPIEFDPIPMSYTELFPLLLQNSLVVPCPMKPIEPPYPRGYDVNAKCDYHAGAISHSIENCRALKTKVQSLTKAGWLNFKEDNPNIGNNPLPGHGGPTVNSIEESRWGPSQ